ncbi:MAG: hypothetical protein AAGP08_15620 [Pseudomonadota bacterium]
MKLLFRTLAAVCLCGIASISGAEVTKLLGYCEFFEGADQSAHDCEILYNSEDDATILASPERLVMFQGQIYGGEIYYEGIRFDAYDGREYGYCFREANSGVALCITPNQ